MDQEIEYFQFDWEFELKSTTFFLSKFSVMDRVSKLIPGFLDDPAIVT